MRYAGASGDFNPIHYRDDVARSVGLPGVLAHGMLTMGFAVQPVVDWVGDPGRVADYQVRFTRPVVVDPEIGAAVTVVAKVGQLDAEARAARIDLTVTFNERDRARQGAGAGLARLDGATAIPFSPNSRRCGSAARPARLVTATTQRDLVDLAA